MKPEIENLIEKCSGVFFDLDGLLADTEEIHIMAYEIVAKKLNIKLTREYMHDFIGVATEENVRKIIRDFNLKNLDANEIIQMRYDCYLEAIKKSKIKPMDGAIEVLLKFKKMGFTTGLVTSSIKLHAEAVLMNLSRQMDNNMLLSDLFDVKVYGEEVNNPKPAPDIYLKAVKKTSLPPDRCIGLEDSQSGTISAKKAGLITIAVPNYHTKNQTFDHADIILTSLRELL